MSRRRHTRRPTRSFTRLLAWTTLLALVFSAGIITGQRLLQRASAGPLISQGRAISLSSARPAAALITPVVPEDVERTPKARTTTFSFYDLLAKRSGPERQPATVDKPERAPLEPSKAKPLAARYTLQVGAHPTLDEARQQMDDLRRAGLEPNLISVPTSQGRVFRVRVGKFHSLKEARHFQAELKSKRELQALVTPI